MGSGAAFHRAYPCATQQAFLEAHQLALEYFEGVFWRLRYDNLSSAVKKILRGQQRELTARFIAFRFFRARPTLWSREKLVNRFNRPTVVGLRASSRAFDISSSLPNGRTQFKNPGAPIGEAEFCRKTRLCDRR